MTHPIYDRLPIEMRAELIEKYEASTKIYRKPFETWNYFSKSITRTLMCITPVRKTRNI